MESFHEWQPESWELRDSDGSTELPFPLTSGNRQQAYENGGSRAAMTQQIPERRDSDDEPEEEELYSESRPRTCSRYCRQDSDDESEDHLPTWQVDEIEREQEKRKRQEREQAREREREQRRNRGSSNDVSLSQVKELVLKAIQKIDENERAIQCLKQEVSAARSEYHSSSVSSSDSKSSKTIPKALKQEVRKVYGVLECEDENFPGWDTSPGKTFSATGNQQVVTKLIKEVRSINPSYDAADIRVAARRFFISRCEEACLKRRGKSTEKRTAKRRHERLVRKKKEREAAVMKNKRLTKEQQSKWMGVMVNSLMSSEESEEDDAISVHPLSWRSKYVTAMFNRIDQYSVQLKSPQSRRQMKVRRIGETSQRPPPLPGIVPEWAIERAIEH